ncbi:hypothetical protein [Streptomyces sp. NPDC017941]|uniref:hypothetical protein n=1 Tax=Streptomyces sp. NPDC017941 TaxID=3365018 RepID=UPI0037A69585
MRPGRPVRLAALALTAVVAATPATAHAAGGEGGRKHQRDSSAQGGVRDGRINIETRVRTKVDGSAGPAKPGKLSSVDGDWTPPACWYEPAFSPKEIEARVKAWRKVKLFGLGDFVGDIYDAYYKDGHPYKDYNLDKQGEGMFWAAAVNPNRKDEPEANACDKLPFWVPESETPEEPLAVSPRILAEYAYDELPLPTTEITMAPEGETKVNLPTWVWLDKAKFKKVSVTASLPDTNISATTTAEPISLRINPGTKDATTYPASGECPIVDGRIGEPWAKGKSKQTPPCGVKYLRSSGNGSYELNATVTWKITWTSTTEGGDRLPDAEFGADQNVVVKEIQSVNR